VCTACEKKSRPCRYQVEKLLLNDDIGEQLVAIQVGQSSRPDIASIFSPRSTERYNNGHLDSEHFKLQCVQRTDDSEGLYLTFARPRNSRKKQRQHKALVQQPTSPASSIHCQESKLIKKWGSVFGYNAMDLNPLGEWLRLAWPVIGDDIAVTHACEFALRSMELFQLRTDMALSQAYTAGTRAIDSLQAAVKTCSGLERTRNLILAVSLHSTAEVSSCGDAPTR
jgi:hypothetical protein